MTRRPFVLILATLTVSILAGCASQDATPVKTNKVNVSGPWVFEPRTIQVTAGTTVTWTNNGGQTHSVTFDDASLGMDKDMAPGQTVTFTFSAPGTYAYHCKYHPPDMVGKVIVTAA